MTAIEPPFTQHWSWHLNQRKPFSSELDQFSIRINFAFQSIAVFKKRNYFTCYFPHNLNDLQFVNIVTASIRFGIQLVGSGCEGWKEKVQHHLSSPAKTNGTLIHFVFLFFIFLHLLYSLSSLSLSFPPLSLSPILLLQGTVWTTAPVCSPVIFLFRCRWIFVIIWNSLQYISLHTVPKMFIIHAASE